MAEASKISWTDSTVNFWYGCKKKTPGCAYCYMFRWARRSGRNPETVTRSADSTFYASLKWMKGRRIFTCSLSDFFIAEADAFRLEAWGVIKDTPQHEWLILTKEIERAPAHIPWLVNESSIRPWPHVVLGVSGENQRMLDRRLCALLDIPVARYFLSLEPLLGPIDLRRHCRRKGFERIAEVMVGGESGGPKYRSLVDKVIYLDGTNERGWRPKDAALEWVRSLRDQCAELGIRFLFKQWGGTTPESGVKILDGRIWDQWAERKDDLSVTQSLF